MSERQKNAIEVLKTLEGINIEQIGNWIWIDGNTKQHKDTIKSLGAFWCSAKTKWYIRPDEDKRKYKGKTKDHDEIRNFYGSRVLQHA